MSDEMNFGSYNIFMRETVALKSDESDRTPRRWLVAERRNNSVRNNLMIAALAAAILIIPCTRIEAQELLSADEIENQIVGHSIKGRMGIMSVSLRYAKDGTVTMRSALGTGKGNWTLSGNSICVKLETGPRRANECFTLVRHPDGGYRASNGMRLRPVD